MKRPSKRRSRRSLRTSARALWRRSLGFLRLGYWPLGRGLLPVVVLVAATAGYTVYTTLASGHLPTGANQVVVEWAHTHHHLAPADRLVADSPVVFRLYGNGLATCVSQDPGTAGLVRARTLDRTTMDRLVQRLDDGGFAQLAANYQHSPLPPAELRNTLSVFENGTLKTVAYYDDGIAKPAAYAHAEAVITQLCSTITELYQPDHVVVRSLRVQDPRGEAVHGRSTDQLELTADDQEQALQVLTGGAAKAALRQFGGGRLHGLVSAGGQIDDLVVDQPLPPVAEPPAQARAQAPGTALADGAKPVRYLMLYAADQGSGDIRAVRLAAADTRGWYTKTMSGKTYTDSSAVTARSVKTAAQLRTCPTGYACGGDELLAIYYNAYLEFYQADKSTVIAAAFPVPGALACGYGALTAGFAVMPMPGRFIAGCGNGDMAAFSSTMGHEFGHNNGFQHTTDYMLMDYRRSCRVTGGIYACGLTASQRTAAYSGSPYFHVVTTSGLCLEPHPSVGSGATGVCVTHLQQELNYVRGAGLTVFGTFDVATLTAVKSFQTAYGLPVTGVMDGTSWAKLHTVEHTLKR